MKISIHSMISQFVKLKNELFAKVDVPLLLFIIFVINYRFSFKIIALIGIYLYRPNFKIERNGITWFYILMPLLGLFNFICISNDYNLNHFSLVFAGCLMWFSCLLVYHQVNLSVNGASVDKLISTIKVIVIFNLLSSLFDFLKIVYITGTINPFTQISPPPYGISSGDLIGGLYGGMHLVNTIISCFLVIFFVYHGSFKFALFSLIPFLLTGSNLGSIILTSVLLYILVFERSIILKYIASSCIAVICFFYIKVTPDNQKYMFKAISSFQSQFLRQETAKVKSVEPTTQAGSDKRALTKEELISLYVRHKTKLRKPKGATESENEEKLILKSVYSFEKGMKIKEARDIDLIFAQKMDLHKAKLGSEFYEFGNLKKFDLDAEAGKITSFKQTYDYLSKNWINAAFGSGIGSFSSRLAFITSGIVSDSRMLMRLPYYETEEFTQNHKAIFKYLMFLDDATHSITNLPFCWYNQIFGEYGILGFVLFVVLYFGFYIKNYSLLTFGRMLLVAMLIFFLFDYWYERISVMVVFELMMLLDIKIKKSKLKEI